MKKQLFIIACLFMATLTAHAQKVTFYSPEFEEGVKAHIGLGENEDVLQTQMDTIKHINLSGLGITDIRDVVYLSTVEELDLSYNEIDDISSLLPLESLRVLNLSNNQLESVNILAFVERESMQVDVTKNYISDFSYFFSPTACEFTFIGMGMQLEKEVSYFDVYHLCADVNDDAVITYRGYTNIANAVSLRYGSSNVSAKLDGNTYQVTITDNLAETTKVILSNGELSEETYVVPTADYRVEAEGSLTMETGLPDDFYISYVHANVGTVEIVNNTIQYTAPDYASPDIIYFSYYKDYSLKGYSRFYVNRDMKGDANGDGDFDLVDVVAMINHILGKPSSRFIPEAADMNDNGEVEIFDVMKAVNLVLNSNITARSKTRATKDTEEKAIVTATSDGILLGINDPARFTAFQFDVEVADGIELTDARLTANTSNHTLRFVKNGQVVSYIGTNFWYGAILGSEGEGGRGEEIVQEGGGEGVPFVHQVHGRKGRIKREIESSRQHVIIYCRVESGRPCNSLCIIVFYFKWIMS